MSAVGIVVITSPEYVFYSCGLIKGRTHTRTRVDQSDRHVYGIVVFRNRTVLSDDSNVFVRADAVNDVR